MKEYKIYYTVKDQDIVLKFRLWADNTKDAKDQFSKLVPEGSILEILDIEQEEQE